MLLEVTGCSLAWGIIDAVFYLLGCLSERGHNLLLLRQVRSTSDPGEATRVIAGALPPLIASRLSADTYESLRRELQQLAEPTGRPRLTLEDWLGALEVFFLVFGSIAPVIIPFVFIADARHAIRISNWISVLLLFLAGYALGRYASQHPWRVGFVMVAIGSALVGVAIALGG
jgi:VIT1/CCC1 family predicted Fe2+/Mn2+ transporter